jgi:hypothetical protein
VFIIAVNMRFVAILFISAVAVTVVSAADDDGFLPGHTCNQAQDCYIFDDTNKGLQLACYYNVNKCKCQNTIRSDYHLEWKDGKCRMSKFGPCGKKGALEVDCLDGFTCVENQCRDPKNTDASAQKTGPFAFDKKCSDGCTFSEDLELDCGRSIGKCVCRKQYIADGRGTTWDIRSYDGDHSCSVGKFGPCGEQNGLKIECHGQGISCVDGTCLDPNHPISELGEACESQKNCKSGLLCSGDSTCIAPRTLPAGKTCLTEEECQAGLKCQHRGPWSSAVCGTESDFKGPQPQ